MVSIFLDPGHGGHDSGAVGKISKEKDLVLDICKRIEKGLKEYKDTKVIMSRDDDTFYSLSDRTREANNMNCDVYLSVHINANIKPEARGFDTHIYPQAGASTIALQNTMHEEIYKMIKDIAVDRGKKKSNFYVLRMTKMKAILTENMFISNVNEEKLLNDPKTRQKIAQGHVNGLEKFFGLEKKEVSKPKEPVKLYRVQIGAYESKDNAEAVVADLTKLGYRPIVKYE